MPKVRFTGTKVRKTESPTCVGLSKISFGKELSFLLRFEFFLNFLNVHGLQYRLEILKLQGLASYSRFSLVFAVFSLESGYCHGFTVKRSAKISPKSGITNFGIEKSRDNAQHPASAPV